ncbi:MAG: septum formation initiator family protein [Candidatus Aceula meridiana]|nr:septum formation initiator family protein [Candidatus Aceula meridiana]
MRNPILLFVIALFILIAFLPSYTKMQDLKARNLRYEKEIQDLSLERDQMIYERQRLENDPEYREKVAREEMGLIRKGEKVYRFVNEL